MQVHILLIYCVIIYVECRYKARRTKYIRIIHRQQYDIIMYSMSSNNVVHVVTQGFQLRLQTEIILLFGSNVTRLISHKTVDFRAHVFRAHVNAPEDVFYDLFQRGRIVVKLTKTDEGLYHELWFQFYFRRHGAEKSNTACIKKLYEYKIQRSRNQRGKKIALERFVDKLISKLTLHCYMLLLLLYSYPYIPTYIIT